MTSKNKRIEWWDRYCLLMSARLKKKLREEMLTGKYRVSAQDCRRLKGVISNEIEKIDKDYRRIDWVGNLNLEEAEKTRQIPALDLFWTEKIMDDSLFAKEVLKYM